VTGGSDALGDVVVQLEIDGRRVTGRGVATDVVEASARAYLAAINRAASVAEASVAPAENEAAGNETEATP
jgi:2-isopropylmalate synthase